MFVKEVSKEESPMHPSIVKLLAEFQGVFPKELPIGLPPIRGIEHQIDLVLGAPLPYKPTYSLILNIPKRCRERCLS